MTRQPPTPPDFTVTCDEPPTCGVSERLQHRINAQFALVAVGLGMAIGVVVAILARAIRWHN